MQNHQLTRTLISTLPTQTQRSTQLIQNKALIDIVNLSNQSHPSILDMSLSKALRQYKISPFNSLKHIITLPEVQPVVIAKPAPNASAFCKPTPIYRADSYKRKSSTVKSNFTVVNDYKCECLGNASKRKRTSTDENTENSKGLMNSIEIVNNSLDAVLNKRMPTARAEIDNDYIKKLGTSAKVSPRVYSKNIELINNN